MLHQWWSTLEADSRAVFVDFAKAFDRVDLLVTKFLAKGVPHCLVKWLHFSGVTSKFIFSSLWSKSDSQLSKYCVVCEISCYRSQQLTALSISTALVIEQLQHPALKFAVSAPWHDLYSSFALHRNKSWRRHTWVIVVRGSWWLNYIYPPARGNAQRSCQYWLCSLSFIVLIDDLVAGPTLYKYVDDTTLSESLSSTSQVSDIDSQMAALLDYPKFHGNKLL